MCKKKNSTSNYVYFSGHFLVGIGGVLSVFVLTIFGRRMWNKQNEKYQNLLDKSQEDVV